MPSGRQSHWCRKTPHSPKLASERGRWQELCRALLMAEDALEEEVQKEDWALGTAEFRQRTRSEAGRPAPRVRGRPCKSDQPAAEGYLF
jgi:hypothetical protein